MDIGFLEIIGFIFIAMSWGWNIVQVYVFFQDKFRPPEEKEQFDGQKSLMLRELYNDMNDRHATFDYDSESGEILRSLQSRIETLYAMHDRADDNGVKLWYVPRGMSRDLTSVLRILRGMRRGREFATLHRRPSSSEGGYESV